MPMRSVSHSSLMHSSICPYMAMVHWSLSLEVAADNLGPAVLHVLSLRLQTSEPAKKKLGKLRGVNWGRPRYSGPIWTVLLDAVDAMYELSRAVSSCPTGLGREAWVELSCRGMASLAIQATFSNFQAPSLRGSSDVRMIKEGRSRSSR